MSALDEAASIAAAAMFEQEGSPALEQGVILNTGMAQLARAAFRALEAAGYRILGPGEGDTALIANPLEWVADHGVAALGPYRLFAAETPLGRFSYGTDSEGSCWYCGQALHMTGDEAAAKRMAEAEWSKRALAESSKYAALRVAGGRNG